jgi:cation diffusion facilitator family transporter
MSNCCQDKACEVEALRARQASTLKIVLALNALMFIVEAGAGVIAGSTALLADSLDMLGDALVYGVSLYVVQRSQREKAMAAMLKGVVMALFGIFVLARIVYAVVFPAPPDSVLMGGVGVLALLANTACLALLFRHRSEDINMRSIWLCSRNDIIANAGVLVAAVAVWVVGSPWPDVAIGIAIAALFPRSSWYVLRESSFQLRLARA